MHIKLIVFLYYIVLPGSVLQTLLRNTLTKTECLAACLLYQDSLPTHVPRVLLRLIHTCRAAPMPRPCIIRQCRVLRESPRGSRNYPNCQSNSLTDWYASDNNLRGTPRGSRKKPNACRSPTCRHWTADANSLMPCHAHEALCRGLEKSLSERHCRGMARARHGMCESNTAVLCKSNGKDTI
jgi:hypothetical protein